MRKESKPTRSFRSFGSSADISASEMTGAIAGITDAKAEIHNSRISRPLAVIETSFARPSVGSMRVTIDLATSIPGFYQMLEARTDPAHPDHSEISEWLDEYDPDVLDVFPIQVALGRIAARRNAAAKLIIKPANDGRQFPRSSPNAYKNLGHSGGCPRR